MGGAVPLHNRSTLFTAQTAVQSTNDINGGGGGVAPPVTASNEFSKMNNTGGLAMGSTTMGGGSGFGHSNSAMSSQKKSLNRDVRRKELIKITLEN